MRSATEILRRFCQDRYLRQAVPSVRLDDEPRSTPLLSHEAWIDSLGLVTGIPGKTLEMLSVWWCEDAGWAWEESLVEIQGNLHELRKERVPVPLKLAAAARRVGMNIDHRTARALLAAAVSVVTDNMVRRATAEGEAA